MKSDKYRQNTTHYKDMHKITHGPETTDTDSLNYKNSYYTYTNKKLKHTGIPY